MTTLYLAYGSNLNKRAMRVRCPTARPLGKIYLSNARLVFRGVADVELCESQPDLVVPCGLWSLNEADEAALDRYEGVGSGLYERWWVPIRGKKKEALFYVMTDRKGIHPPSQYYVDTILEGYKNFGFTKNDRKIFWDAVYRSGYKVPSDQTIARRERQKKDPKQRQLVCFGSEASS